MFALLDHGTRTYLWKLWWKVDTVGHAPDVGLVLYGEPRFFSRANLQLCPQPILNASHKCLLLITYSLP